MYPSPNKNMNQPNRNPPMPGAFRANQPNAMNQNGQGPPPPRYQSAMNTPTGVTAAPPPPQPLPQSSYANAQNYLNNMAANGGGMAPPQMPDSSGSSAAMPNVMSPAARAQTSAPQMPFQRQAMSQQMQAPKKMPSGPQMA